MRKNVERSPIVYIIDSSESMDHTVQGIDNDAPRKIEQVRSAVEIMLDSVKEDFPFDFVEYEFAHIDCGNDRVSVQQEFLSVDDFVFDIPDTSGSAPIGTAILHAIKLCVIRADYYEQNGLPYQPPMVVLLSDGNYDDMSRGDQRWTEIKKLLDAFHPDDHRWTGARAHLNFAYWAPSDSDVGPLSHLIEPFALDVPPDSDMLYDYISPRVPDTMWAPPDERPYDSIYDVLTTVDVDVHNRCLECGEDLSDQGTIDLNFCPVCGAEV